MTKDHLKKKGASLAQIEREVELARRARITASLREQRLKRDAEIAATEPPVAPPKRGRKPEVA